LCGSRGDLSQSDLARKLYASKKRDVVVFGDSWKAEQNEHDEKTSYAFHGTNYNPRPMGSMRRFSPLLKIVLLILFVRSASAQTDALTEARSAMAGGDYARAAALLSESIKTQPSADAYVYLGISYAHTREWMRAEEVLKEGSVRYSQDPRFHNELAGVYLAANDLDRARQSLQNALAVDRANKYATDLLATVDMSMGQVESALKTWNKDGRPIIGDILHNSHAKASTLRTGETLTWGKWKTTETRLRETGIYSNVGIDIEPTTSPDRYTAVIRTAPKTNSTEQLVIPALEAIFFKTPSLHFWNVANTGTSLSARYRFATNRLGAEVGVLAPLPLPGLLFFEATGTFRSERWDISRPAIDTGVDHRFYYQSTGVRALVRHIPNYRFAVGAGFEYRNRTVHGSQAGLALDSRNTGKLLLEATLLPFDGRYRSRIRGESFIAKKTFLSDMNYSGGTVEWNNRYLVDKEGKNTVEVTIKSGTSRGELPVDDYFILGLRQRPDTLLRGHNVVSHTGHYGDAPMGTSFTLVNTTYDHLIRRLPFFNVLNVPYIDLKWLVFVDGARTFDRAHVFNEGKILVDVGGGFRLDSPTRVFNLTYGRSLRDGTGTFAAYVGRRW
jgi:tetratricopeptide repeat protein